MICSSCNAEIADSSKFCPECGAKLTTALVCSNCGFSNGSVFKFCPECGTKQDGKSPEVVARLSILEKLTPNIDSLISAILDDKMYKDDSARSIFPFRAKCFRNLYVAYSAKVYDNDSLFVWAEDSTIAGMPFADYSLTADELIEDLKKQLLLASSQSLLEENWVARTLQKKYGIDCSGILHNEYGLDDSCLEHLKMPLNNLILQIKLQAAYYPKLKQAIDDLKNYVPPQTSSIEEPSPVKKHLSLTNILAAGQIALGLYNGQDFAVLRGARNLLSNMESENQSELENVNDDGVNEYNQLVENLKNICQQIMNVADAGINAAMQFEIAFNQWHTSCIKGLMNYAKNEFSVNYRLLEKGFSIEQIAEVIDDRTKQWKRYHQIFNQFKTYGDIKDDFAMLTIYAKALDSLVINDSVKGNDLWKKWCILYKISSDAESLLYYPNEESSTFEELSELAVEIIDVLRFHSIDVDRKKQLLLSANKFFRDSSIVYISPLLKDNAESADTLSANEYFDLETLEKMRDAIAKDLWLEEISFSIYDRDSNVGIIAAQDTLYIKALDQSWSLKYSQINNVNFYKTSSEFSENYCLRVNQYGFQFTSVMEADLRTFCDFINNSKNSLL